jgi:hypothetical protein
MEVITSDHWKPYESVIPEEKHVQSKAETLDISVMLTPRFGDIDPPCSKWFKEQIV